MSQNRGKTKVVITSKTLKLIAATLIPALISVFFPIFFYITLMMSGGIIIIIFIETFILLSLPKPLIEPEKDKYSVSINRADSINLKVRSTINYTKIKFRIEYPKNFNDVNQPNFFKIKKGTNICKYDFISHKRRSIKVKKIYTRLTLFNFVELEERVECNFTIDVTPDSVALSEFIKLSKLSREMIIGSRKNRIINEGTEFESLREYVPGDDATKIDQKSSARSKTPIIKNFTREHNNEITVIIDCGRLMNTEYENMSYLDYCINSVLIFSWSVLKQGDRLNLIACSNTIQSSLMGIRGTSKINEVKEFCSRIQASYEETSYTKISEYLLNNIKKRSYVIFFTDICENYNDNAIMNLKILQKKHQVFFLLFSNSILEEEIKKIPTTKKELFISTSAKDIFLTRKKTILNLSRSGIKSADINPKSSLNAALDIYNNFRRV
ncbi:MAG: DUF58 domain-containing protein [Spirochaetales bacterium]|nr:DUF58 domain-containing protein [Spirochaetales bacterium]